MTIVLRADDGRILLIDNLGAATIGRRRDSDLVIADSSVSKQHARVLSRDGRTIVVDLKSAGGTRLNGETITQPTIVREDDVIRIGQTNITCKKHRPGDNDVNITPKIQDATDPKEREMLDQLEKNPADNELRQVYGDWLMDRGRTGGEMVALEPHLRELPNDERLKTKVHEAATKLDIERRVLLSIAPIEHCKNKAEKKHCPGSWDQLLPAHRPAIRTCITCGGPVFFVPAMNLARWHSRQSPPSRIVIDVALRRQENDLFQGPQVILDTGAPDTER